MVGELDAVAEGVSVALVVDDAVKDGELEGEGVGDGEAVGEGDCVAVGDALGVTDGEPDCVAVGDGESEGDAEGDGDGDGVSEPEACPCTLRGAYASATSVGSPMAIAPCDTQLGSARRENRRRSMVARGREQPAGF